MFDGMMDSVERFDYEKRAKEALAKNTYGTCSKCAMPFMDNPGLISSPCPNCGTWTQMFPNTPPPVAVPAPTDETVAQLVESIRLDIYALYQATEEHVCPTTDYGRGRIAEARSMWLAIVDIFKTAAPTLALLAPTEPSGEARITSTLRQGQILAQRRQRRNAVHRCVYDSDVLPMQYGENLPSNVERYNSPFCKCGRVNHYGTWLPVADVPSGATEPTQQQALVTDDVFRAWVGMELRRGQDMRATIISAFAEALKGQKVLVATPQGNVVMQLQPAAPEPEIADTKDDGSIVYAAQMVLLCSEAWAMSFRDDLGIQEALQLLRQRTIAELRKP